MASAKWWLCPTCGKANSDLCSNAFHVMKCPVCGDMQEITARAGCPEDQLWILDCGHAWNLKPRPPEGES